MTFFVHNRVWYKAAACETALSGNRYVEGSGGTGSAGYAGTANSSNETRLLPDALDVAAALGSDAALTILEESGAADFAGYGYGAKLLCSFLMLAGRLELLPMFILFTGSVWKNIG